MLRGAVSWVGYVAGSNARMVGWQWVRGWARERGARRREQTITIHSFSHFD